MKMYAQNAPTDQPPNPPESATKIDDLD